MHRNSSFVFVLPMKKSLKSRLIAEFLVLPDRPISTNGQDIFFSSSHGSLRVCGSVVLAGTNSTHTRRAIWDLRQQKY